ncbi:MAG TPA: NAD(P)-dependent oxidoreductase, partial [Fimbriimonas sp.]|nr:NAD(P)-dependent oxidoreductase [Fimbriimonas sp.]
MATIYYTQDVDPQIIQSLNVGIVGYGSQGHAHALNLKDSGVNVRVGLHEGSKSKDKAETAGLQVTSVAELAQWADVLMFCVPDVPMSDIYKESVEPNLRDGQTLLFAHGFNIHYKLITPPSNVNVGMIAPKGPGHRLRYEYEHGAGMPALIAVFQDADGKAKATALSYGWGIGSAKAGI